MAREYTLGIKGSYPNQRFFPLSSESMSSEYDYICCVDKIIDKGGNGYYSVSFMNTNAVLGMPMGKWKLATGTINFDWKEATSHFILIDSHGCETEIIHAFTQKGVKSNGIDFESHALSIYDIAKSIAEEYPSSAKKYNALVLLEKSKKAFVQSWELTKDKNRSERLSYFIENTLALMNSYIKNFKVANNLLGRSNDPKAKKLLAKITEEHNKLLAVTDKGLIIQS